MFPIQDQQVDTKKRRDVEEDALFYPQNAGRILKGHSEAIQQLNFLSRNLLASRTCRETKIWDLTTGKCIRTLECPSDTPLLQHLPNSRLFLNSNASAVFKNSIWNFRTKKCLSLERVEGVLDSDPITSLQSLPNNMSSSRASGNIEFFDTRTGEWMGVVKGSASAVTSQEQLPTGLLATGSADGTIHIWNLEEVTCILTLNHGSAIRCLRTTPRGLLVSGATDGTIKIWDPPQTDKFIRTLQGHSSAVMFLEILPDDGPDDGLLISRSIDQTIKVWRLSTGECIQKTLPGWIQCLQSEPSGILVAGLDDKDETSIKVDILAKLKKEVKNLPLKKGEIVVTPNANNPSKMASNPTLPYTPLRTAITSAFKHVSKSDASIQLDVKKSSKKKKKKRKKNNK